MNFVSRDVINDLIYLFVYPLFGSEKSLTVYMVLRTEQQSMPQLAFCNAQRATCKVHSAWCHAEKKMFYVLVLSSVLRMHHNFCNEFNNKLKKIKLPRVLVKGKNAKLPVRLPRLSRRKFPSLFCFCLIMQLLA